MIRASTPWHREDGDPVAHLVAAVTKQAIKDAKEGDGSAWHYLWTCAPDLAQRVWDEHSANVPDGDAVRPVADGEIASDNERRRRRKQHKQAA